MSADRHRPARVWESPRRIFDTANLRFAPTRRVDSESQTRRMFGAQRVDQTTLSFAPNCKKKKVELPGIARNRRGGTEVARKLATDEYRCTQMGTAGE